MAMTAADKQRMKEIKERYPFDIKSFVKSAEKSEHGICITTNKDTDEIGVTNGYIGFLRKGIQQTISDLVFLHGADDLNRGKLDFNKFISMFESDNIALFRSDMELVKGDHYLGFYYNSEEKILVPVSAGYADILQKPLYIESVKNSNGIYAVVASYRDGTQFIILPVKWMRSGEKYKAVCAYHGIEVD